MWLKPLLLVFDYAQIRVLNTVLQIALAFSAFCAALWIKRSKTPHAAVPCSCSCSSRRTALFQSFQFSWVFYVFAVSVLALLLRFERLRS